MPSRHLHPSERTHTQQYSCIVQGRTRRQTGKAGCLLFQCQINCHWGTSTRRRFEPMQSTCIAAGEGDYQIGGLVARIFRNQIIRFIAFTSFYLALTGTLCGFSSAQALFASAVDPKAALSPLVFDVSYFKSVNPAFAHLTDAQATSQWLNHGAAAGLRAHPLFWSKQYLAFYADLRATFGATNYPAAIEHYVSTGHSEGREGVLALTPNVFDLSYYTSTNLDLQ